jgi:hypothetical protein
MHAYRADRVVRVLTAIISFFYYTLWVGGAVVVIAAPLATLTGADADWTLGFDVPATIERPIASVAMSWGTASLQVEDVPLKLELPVGALPWRMFVVVWLDLVLRFGLTLLAAYHLRKIFQRVRDGAPFDAVNAVRLRWIGLLMLALAVLTGVETSVMSFIAAAGLQGEGVSIDTGVHLGSPLILVALMLIMLGEIFRRGAELETEQALVV